MLFCWYLINKKIDNCKYTHLFKVLQNFGAEENRFLKPFFLRTGDDDPGKSFIIGASAGRRPFTCVNNSSNIFNFPIYLGGVLSKSLQPKVQTLYQVIISIMRWENHFQSLSSLPLLVFSINVKGVYLGPTLDDLFDII